MAVRAGGREAITHWERLETYPGSDGKPVASMIACRLETGRTHQIRVHLAHIGHPLLGDSVYGPGFKTKAALLPPDARIALENLGRQALHAYLLGFEHPLSGDTHAYRSGLPPDLAGSLATKVFLKNQQPDHRRAVVRALTGGTASGGQAAELLDFMEKQEMFQSLIQNQQYAPFAAFKLVPYYAREQVEEQRDTGTLGR